MSTEESEDPAVDAAMRERLRFEVLVRRMMSEYEKEPRERISISKHPAFLVALTFILTGVFGSLLTSCWHAQEWGRTQAFRLTDEATKEREVVMTLTTEGIAETFTAAEDILHLFAWEWSPDSPIVNLKERGAEWSAASRKWRVAEKTLRARVRASYVSGSPQVLLDEIVLQRRRLGNDIQYLLSIADAASVARKYTPQQEEEIAQLTANVQGIINATTGRGGTLEQLVGAMIAETRANEAIVDTTVWTLLRRSAGFSR